MTTKKAIIIVGAVAGVALVTSVWSLILRADDNRILSETFEMLRSYFTEVEFANIVERYNDD